MGMKAQGDEDGRRILLGDNTVGEAVMLRPIRLQCFFSLDINRIPFYMHA